MEEHIRMHYVWIEWHFVYGKWLVDDRRTRAQFLGP